MYFVYILQSELYAKTYIGITNDTDRRLEEHNSGRHVYTKRFIPWRIIYRENSIDRQAARKREKYFKSAAGRRWMKDNLFK